MRRFALALTLPALLMVTACQVAVIELILGVALQATLYFGAVAAHSAAGKTVEVVFDKLGQIFGQSDTTPEIKFHIDPKNPKLATADSVRLGVGKTTTHPKCSITIPHPKYIWSDSQNKWEISAPDLERARKACAISTSVSG